MGNPLKRATIKKWSASEERQEAQQGPGNLDMLLQSGRLLITENTSSPRKQRTRYKESDIDDMLAIVEAEPSVNVALRKINSMPGNEKVTHTMITRWIHKRSCSSVKLKLGRPVNVAYEQQVLKRCIQTSPSKFFSYETVRSAAQHVREHDSENNEWKKDAHVQDIKFSNRWIIGFLRRHGLSCSDKQSTALVKSVEDN